MTYLRRVLNRVTQSAVVEEERTYLLLDATWQESLAERIRSRADGWEPLMGAFGEKKNDAHMRSPLLVDISVHETAVDEWLLEGFPEKLGVILVSPLPIDGLRSSLKRFMTVMTPEFEKPAYFRFYDARALYCFLSTGFPQQWKDFFEDISLIMAPSDLTTGWTAYRFDGDRLLIGLNTPPSETFDWHRPTQTGPSDPAYRAFWPFRRFSHDQYELMQTCSTHAFHHEIYDFLIKAFPKDTAEYTREDLLNLIARARTIGEQQGYKGEDCSFYWAVLSFMGGLDFYKEPNIALWFEIEYHTPEFKLERLIEATNEYVNNPHLTDLIDSIEDEEEYSDGTVVRYKERSGRLISVSEAR